MNVAVTLYNDKEIKTTFIVCFPDHGEALLAGEERCSRHHCHRLLRGVHQVRVHLCQGLRLFPGTLRPRTFFPWLIFGIYGLH
jgi:hypothetical protein